ncbi:MAG: hypothetical protein HQL54_01865 [Magnetococcales bacterium]|nr:hypothetical protein [Magnetococcales bacterium]
MVFAVVLIFVPFVGGQFTFIPALMAAFSSMQASVSPRSILFGAAAVFVNLINLAVLSPLVLWGAKSGIYHGEYKAVIVAVGLVLVQVGAGVVLLLGYRRLKVSKNKGQNISEV